ncbi:MAG: hypothetical protein ACR2QC_01530 [Gammaproteobacteria bacterium]
MTKKEALRGKEVLVRYEGELRRLIIWKASGKRIVACPPDSYERLVKGLAEPQISYSREDVLDPETREPLL